MVAARVCEATATRGAPIRRTYPTTLILTALAAGYRYGFDIMDATGLPSGTVHPALRRMQDARLVRVRRTRTL
jgi:hypothetical protein